VTSKALYRDVVPYDAPVSLNDLRGPGSGLLELPVTVHWGPRRVFDLDQPALVRAAYRAIVREGTPQVQESLLNADLLRRTWADLVLPVRCQALWETRFPELSASR
jgi:hypothetical protein